MTPRLEQQDRRLRWWWREWETRSMVYIDASGGDGKNEKQYRHLQRQGWRCRWQETFNPIQSETHWSSPFNLKTTRNKGIKSDWWQWWSAEVRGRKIDERKKDGWDERKRELGAWEREWELRVSYRENREKIVKKLYTHATVPVQICMSTVATCIYTQVYTHWYERFFCSDCVKFVTFSIL